MLNIEGIQRINAPQSEVESILSPQNAADFDKAAHTLKQEGFRCIGEFRTAAVATLHASNALASELKQAGIDFEALHHSPGISLWTKADTIQTRLACQSAILQLTQNDDVMSAVAAGLIDLEEKNLPELQLAIKNTETVDVSAIKP